MKAKNTKCIILGHKNLGEYDKWIFLYSEELGKIKAIAKGSRKITSKFTGHLETLNICTCSLYFGPKNTILTEIISNENHKKIRRNLEKASGALQIAEITNQVIPENQNLDRLINLIEKTIQHLETSEKSSLIVNAFIIKLLDKVGIIPNFKEVQSSLPEKYLKFFHYLKEKSLTEIEKIHLTPKENIQIKKIIKQIIENETEKNFNYYSL